MSEEQNPTSSTVPTTTTDAPAAAAAPPAPAPITMTHDQFEERLRRAQRSYLRDTFGTDDPDTLKQRLEAAAGAEAEAEQRRQAEMSELQREREARERAEARAAEYEIERDNARFEALVSGYCAELGISGLDYAKFKIVERIERMGDDEGDLDTKAFLGELLTDPRHAAALGAVLPGRGTPATTTATAPEPGAPAPGRDAKEPNAFDLDAAAWAARRRALGLQ